MRKIWNIIILGWELHKLYQSEINVRITSFWDGGWYVCLGDEVNGYQVPEWDCCDLDSIVPAIRELARVHYPNSKYTKGI